MLGPSRRLGLWCMLAILSPKQAANDCDSQGDLHQRPSYSSNRVVPLDQSFEGPNADIKETAPAWGAEAAYQNSRWRGRVPVGCSLRSTPPSAVESKPPARESFQATWLHVNDWAFAHSRTSGARFWRASPADCASLRPSPRMALRYGCATRL
jgi:hypothetical protein